VNLKAIVLAEPVLVGRERELEELMRSSDSAFEGKGTTIFVSGEAGAGKTRFVNEFLSSVKHKREITTLAGWCLSNAAVPYFPFIEAFNAYFATRKSEEEEAKQTENEETEIKAWLMGPKKAENLSSQAWKDLTFAAVTKALFSISAKKPTILFIDDLHWADSASLALLHYISRTIAAERVLVLATFRSEELGPNAEGHPHPLVEALRLMRREDLFREIKLPNLSRTNIFAMAENMVGGSLTSEFAAKLAEESHGNPLFIVESLRMLSEHGSLIEECGQWSLSVDELGIPAKIKDIILQRVGALKPNQRRVLDLASVIGEKFNVELLGAVLGQDSLGVLETLNSVVQSSSLVVCEGDFYRFDHEKSREALYEEISQPLRRGFHARIAKRLEASSKDAKELRVNDLAYHYAKARNKEKAVKYALVAGNDALARFSNVEAIKYFTHVVQATGEDPAYADERGSALEGLGDAFYANNMFTEAIKAFERLANMGTGVLRLRALRKAMDIAFFQGDYPRLMELVKKAEDYTALDRLESARVHMNKARIFVAQNMPARATEHFEEALRVFEEAYSLWDAAWVLVAVGIMRSWMGKLEEGLAASLRSIALFDEVGDPRWRMEAYNGACQNFSSCLLNEEAMEMYAKAVEIDKKMKLGDYSKLFQISLISASILEDTGDLAGALSENLKALEYLRKTESDMHAIWVYENLTSVYTKLGDLKRAEEYFKRLMKLSQVERFILPYLIEAVFYAGKNQWTTSTGYFKESLESLKKPHLPMAEPAIRANYAWALKRQGRDGEAKTQLEKAQRVIEKTKKRFEHVNVQTSVMAPTKVGVDQKFDARLDIVNVARTSGAIVKVDNLIPPEFRVTSLPAYCNLQYGSVDMNERKISPFHVETVKLTLQAAEAGVFTLDPQVVYIDDLGETKTCKPNPVAITVQKAQPAFEVMPDRITTGFEELDALLLGGIPENYAIMLASPSCDERELLVKKFLWAGARADQTIFHLTAEAASTKLVEEFKSNFYLFLCNPRADAMVQSLPNVFKLKGVENLTDIDIALTKAFRTLKRDTAGPQRACIDLVSDVLLQHHAVTTRKWLSGLLPDLKSKGFTTLAVIDPQMHPPEEARAIMSLFDGEIEITQKETAKGPAKILGVRKLYNQRYLEHELPLTKEKLLP
jgi:tetratricopeptide (TPR) repeat protein/KaiC/GvpD/RAD55 family RecA-like ATPase